ncbi:MAG: methylated-DNA--[protein]-cysteine S-methyltransferase [Gammaproteobacteria bacterium]|nr:methylated-DNA--[protein]-cysteine S-methyltransferase [Gammaproteobacteria bacterium]MBU1653615.1 methylated-DNA--[protein]-cysteine S-methyltransferase [Gammaproteobacteria bacterium]MBU1960980.1 methylated-DNA--[protein]-cysteine S-methyltransferase [Gammaproteobacteria bacterium]
MGIEADSLAWLETPLGGLRISTLSGFLIAIDFLPLPEAALPKPDAVGLLTQRALAVYFENAAHSFQIPLRLAGTVFQREVWRVLQGIPPGRVMTYGELARQLGTSPRAVGNACRHNPCPIVVPCHRVVSAQGLGGYDGQTEGPLLERKRWLLRHEGAIGV